MSTLRLTGDGYIVREDDNLPSVVVARPAVNQLTAEERRAILALPDSSPLRQALIKSDGAKPSWGLRSRRMLLGSYGDSINSQDIPADLFAGANGVSPLHWVNTLSLSAFDYYAPYDGSIVVTGGTQQLTVSLRSGCAGSSGALIQQAIKFGIDQYIDSVLANAAGRPWAVLLSGGINDLALAGNNFVGADAAIWADYQLIVNKIKDAGGFILSKVREPSANFDSRAKRRNREAFAQRMEDAYGDDPNFIVMDIQKAWQTYGRGLSWERCTRGTTGDVVHPNVLGSILHGFAARDAMGGKMKLCAPWEHPDFSGTLVTTVGDLDGTTGTLTNTTGVVPTGWNANTFGANSSAVSSKVTDGIQPGARLVVSAAAGVVSDAYGYSTLAAPSVVADGPLYQAFQDFTVMKADLTTHVGYSIRRTGSTFDPVGSSSTTDTRVPTLAAPEQSAPKLLEGHRMIAPSRTFKFPASPTGTLHNVCGGGGLADATAKVDTIIRFAGLFRY